VFEQVLHDYMITELGQQKQAIGRGVVHQCGTYRSRQIP
jgi:hypothetical protein